MKARRMTFLRDFGIRNRWLRRNHGVSTNEHENSRASIARCRGLQHSSNQQEGQAAKKLPSFFCLLNYSKVFQLDWVCDTRFFTASMEDDAFAWRESCVQVIGRRRTSMVFPDESKLCFLFCDLYLPHPHNWINIIMITDHAKVVTVLLKVCYDSPCKNAWKHLEYRRSSLLQKDVKTPLLCDTGYAFAC